MSRLLLTISRALAALLILTFAVVPAGCPTTGGDDDDATGDDDDATGDDDDATGDDDDSTANYPVSESEPNDAHPFQDIGVLDVGRTIISGTLSTAGHENGGAEWLNGDIDAFTFQLVSAASVDFSLDWGSDSDDLDLLLFASLDASDQLGWDSNQEINESATGSRPESFTSPLSGNVNYTILLGNFEGAPNVAYTLTIDVP